MGLKDDFLEALNSVKRDIFNGSDDTDSEKGQTDESANMQDAFDPVYAEYRNSASQQYEAAPSMDDEAVFGAFKQASTIDDAFSFQDGSDDEDDGLHSDDSFTSSSAPPTFKSYDPDAVSGDDNSYVSGPPVVAGGNRIYDFDRTDLYSDDKTIISKNTIIRGALQTDDSVRLLGQVHGDIDCKSNIVVAGKVRGNTSAANAYIMDAQVDGSLQCDDVVSVSSDAWVLGDIRAQQAEIDGKIKGNLDIRHAVSIGSTSSIIGNISTDELEIKRGAFINGQIMMYTPSRDVLDRFDHFEK